MTARLITKNESKEDTVKLYTLEEYFLLEETAPYKNEFNNGKIVPMAGGTYNHNTISGTIYALLFMLFFDSEQQIGIYNSDQKVYIKDYSRGTYTDTFAVVGKEEMYKGGNQAIVNPTLIVEVSSDSTEKFDRTAKFRMYQSLPSFQEYVIVSQTMPIVEVFHKIDDNKWQMTSYVGLDKTVRFETLHVELKMSDIYKKAKNLQDPQSAIDFPEGEGE